MASLGDTMFDPSTCTRRGLCPVTQIRHEREPLESHSLYFEVHGTGSEKILFIMGLNQPAFAWVSQVEHFGKQDKYTTLVFDNRGVGMSGSPHGPYSTSGMAEDILCLLDYLGWTEDRGLHVVGASMGGMIAQELASRIPQRIVSLSLVVTRAGGSLWANMLSLSGCIFFARALLAVNLEDKLSTTERMLFPSDWLGAVAEDDVAGRTNKEVQRERFRHRMACTRQSLMGVFGQIAAGMTHSMAPHRLAKVSAVVPKVLILSAVEDVLIPHVEGERLKQHMPEAEYQCWEQAGHGICVQFPKRFNQLLEGVFEEGRKVARERVDW